MRSILISSLIILAFCACSSYQYLTLQSPQVSKNIKMEFSWENDTMRINYNFNGLGGPIIISIYNKTDKPLYINWNKSALVRGGHASSLASSTVQVNGSVTTYGRRISYGSLNASFDMPEGVNLIPPGSDITKNMNALVDTVPISVQFLPDSTKTEKLTAINGFTYKYKRYLFSQERSPLQFKSYLTFVLGNNTTQEFSVGHFFYANELVLTKVEPELFSANWQGADKLYFKQTQ